MLNIFNVIMSVRYLQSVGFDLCFALLWQTKKTLLHVRIFLPVLQLETERAAFDRLEKEQAQTVNEVEESLSQQQQLSSTLTLELQKASSLAQEEAQKASRLHTLLQEETSAFERLQGLLEDEKKRVAQAEAATESQLAEFDTEREQMKARLGKEETRNRELERQLEELRKTLADPGKCKQVKEPESEESFPKLKMVSTSVQTDFDGKTLTFKSTSVSKVNGCKAHRETDVTQEDRVAENGVLLENGGGALLQSHPHPQSPSSTASSSLSSSPISSPILTKRLGSPGFHQSAYQAGVNQRFQAARHKFQSQAELEQLQQHGGPLSPRDLSPTTSIPPPPEHSAAKQLARNTVTQVLSRFTSQQAGVKLAPISNSPFGTDYRAVAASPTGCRSPSAGPLSPGIRSPLPPRSERTHPPPTPPKKPGVSPPPGSPSHSSRTSAFPELTGNCGHSGQEGAKEPDLLVSSSS